MNAVTVSTNLVAAIILLVLCYESVPAMTQATETAPGVLDISIIVNGNSFKLNLDPEKDSALTLAKKLCTSQAALIGISTLEELNSCSGVVTEYVQGYIDRWVESRKMTVPLVIRGLQFDITMFPDREEPAVLANRLCQDHADTLGLTPDALPECSSSVSMYIQRAVNLWYAARTIEIPLSVNEQKLSLKFMPERESAALIAERFCRDQGTTLLGVPADDIQVCTDPVQIHIEKEINKWMEERTIRLKLQLVGHVLDIDFLPEVENTVSTATRVCEAEAARLGIGKANLVTNCVEPIAEALSFYVDEWVADKTLNVPMVLNDNLKIDVTFLPNRQTVESVADSVCREQGEALKLTDATFQDFCVQPIATYLEAAVADWRTMKEQNKSEKQQGQQGQQQQ